MPTVFISYSHDSPEHKKWVSNLAARLADDGLDVHIDQDESHPAEGFPKWMVQELQTADFVICVCTAKYQASASGAGGKGVMFETTLIYQQIYDSGSQNTRFIPVLPPNGSPTDIPLLLRPFRYYRPDLATDYADLRSRLFGDRDERSAKSDRALRTTGDGRARSVRYRVRAVSAIGSRVPRNILAMNNAGQVVGDSHLDGEMSHAFWQGHDLILSGDEFSFAYDLNDAGALVGLSARTRGPVRAFVYRGGEMTDLSNFTGNPSVAYGINNFEAVVGSASINGRFDAFSLELGKLTLLGSPGGSPAKRITDWGLIIGDGWIHDGRNLTTFGWDSYVNTYDANNLGEIVGQAGQQVEKYRAFLYTDGKMMDLGNLGGSFARAVGINDRSEIVGYSTNLAGEPRAFVYLNHRMSDLNSLLEESDGWILEVASAINNRGQIAGSGRLNGAFRGFILERSST